MPDADHSTAFHGPASHSHAQDTQLLVDAAYAAGGIAMGWWQRDPRVWHKGAGGTTSPVSEADFAVDSFLSGRLRTARPGYGWLSEETKDNPDRLGHSRVLIVDPIDGTRAYLAGSTEWTISLAVVEDGRPVAAALYRPATDTMYAACAGGGATVDGAPMPVLPEDVPQDGPLAIAGPGPYARLVAKSGFAAGEHSYVPSLALRIALSATGRYHLSLARPGASDWDIAAAHLVLEEAGGQLADSQGKTPRYNRPDPRHGVLVGGAKALVQAVLPAFSAVAHGVVRDAT